MALLPAGAGLGGFSEAERALESQRRPERVKVECTLTRGVGNTLNLILRRAQCLHADGRADVVGQAGLRTFRPTLDPCLNEKPGDLLISRSWLPSGAGIPSPPDEIVFCDVLLQGAQTPTAIQFDVLQLHANFPERLVLPSHRQGSKAPPRMTWNTPIVSRFMKRSISFGMTTTTSGFEMTCFPTPDRGQMCVLIIALQRTIARRVAIHATRMCENLPDLFKNSSRAFGSIGDRLKLFRGFEIPPEGLLRRHWR